MPIEGFLVKGAYHGSRGGKTRTAEDVNTELVTVYQAIAERSGKIVLKETIMTPRDPAQNDLQYRQDTHILVDFATPSVD